VTPRPSTKKQQAPPLGLIRRTYVVWTVWRRHFPCSATRPI
jgi:hypothetical protein